MYRLSKSPKKDKKFRIVIPSGKSVDFGGKGYSDYTIHKDLSRMRLYVQRHGGSVPNRNKDDLQNRMLKVKKSSKENWTKSGINSAGFWSRWLLWSYPNLKKAKNHIETSFNIVIK